MEIVYKYTSRELIQDLRLIGETYKLGSHPTETLRGKRLYAQIIPQEFENEAEEMIAKAKHAYSHGLANDVIMTREQMIVLKLLCKYCMAL